MGRILRGVGAAGAAALYLVAAAEIVTAADKTTEAPKTRLRLVTVQDCKSWPKPFACEFLGAVQKGTIGPEVCRVQPKRNEACIEVETISRFPQP